MMQICESWALERSEENEEPPKGKAPAWNMRFVMENATENFYMNNNNRHHHFRWVW